MSTTDNTRCAICKLSIGPDEETYSSDHGEGIEHKTCRDASDEAPTTLRALGSDLLSSLDLHHVDRYGDGVEGLEPGDGIGYGDLDAARSIEDADAVGLSVLVGSDYSGGSVVRANVREVRRMVEEAEDEALSPVVVDVSGGYGTDGVVFLLDRPAPADVLGEVVDLLRGLLDYPAVSDEAVSEIENEDEEEAWQNGAESDFASALVDRITPDAAHGGTVSVDVEGTEATDLRSLFCSLADSGNHNGGPGVIHEETGPYFMVEDVAGEASPVLLFALGMVRLDPSDLLDLAAETDEEAREEARRLRRLDRLGLALRVTETEIRNGLMAETEARRVEEMRASGALVGNLSASALLSRLSDEARAAIQGEATRTAREIVLRCIVEAGDTSEGLSADLPAAQVSAVVHFKRYRYGAGTGLDVKTASVTLDPARSWQGAGREALSSLFDTTTETV